MLEAQTSAKHYFDELNASKGVPPPLPTQYEVKHKSKKNVILPGLPILYC
jgi:hypothetical protein